MARKLPVIGLVLAIFNIVFVVLGMSCAGCNTLLTLLENFMLTNPPEGADMAELNYVAGQLPFNPIVDMTRAVLLFFLAAILLTGGIGLFFRANWARWTCLCYSFLALIVHIGYALYRGLVYFPVARAFYIEHPEAPGAGGATRTSLTAFQFAFFGVMFLVLIPFLAHAVAVLFILLLPSVSAAFTEEDGEESEDKPRRSRRRRSQYDD